MVKIDNEARSRRWVDVAQVQVLVNLNVRIPPSMALDVDGVRFVLQIAVEDGLGES